MSKSHAAAEFDGLDALLDRFVAVWEDGGYEAGAESPVGRELWKWEYQRHIQEAFLDDHDVSALVATDVEELVEAFDEPVGIDTPIPVYMLGGGANGGIAWRDFKDISLADPAATAETLSFFFDPTEDLEDRIDAFQAHYGAADTGPGSLLGLAGCLLMFVHPDRYVHYKWTEMREFFSEYSVYTVRQGFDSGQYRALNDACQTLLDRLEERIPEASMLHVQTLIWSWDDLMGADEHGDETDATASEEDDTATDEDAVAVDALREAAPDDVAFYWVNQTHDEELENGYLRSVDRKWQRDLTVLDPGDVVFHYRRKELRACSVVSKEAYREAYDGEQQYFVDLDTELLVDPLALDDVRGTLMTPAVRQDADKYPLDKNGNVIQAYLCHLPSAAGTYLLDEMGMDVPAVARDDRYFWVNAEATDWHHDGGEVFYEVTDRRNPDAYRAAHPGDDVLVYQIAPARRVVGRAHVTRELHEQPTEDDDGASVQGITLRWDESLDGVAWSEVTEDSELRDSRLVESDNSFVVTELTEREYERILELDELSRYEDYADELAVPAADVTVDGEGLHFPPAEWERIQSRVEQALVNGNHVLLFGPPGTGKTKLARYVCEATVGDGQYELVTASADWSTFDTVGGYQTTAENTLEFEPGVILDRFQGDDRRPTNEWLVIDELNRADIDKAFGSLFSALTGESVTLPFDGSDGAPIEVLDSSRTRDAVTENRFFIPEDWRMLATMNTLDKTSLYEMSYAFMRRWAFVPVGIPELPERTDGDDAELEALVADYVAVWAADGGVPEAQQHYEPVGRIWRAVNEERSLGPAIVEDVYEHVASAPSREAADYVSPLIMYVFPQLEGLRRNELERLVERLDAIVDDGTDELWTVARDFFQVDLQSSEAE